MIAKAFKGIGAAFGKLGGWAGTKTVHAAARGAANPASSTAGLMALGAGAFMFNRADQLAQRGTSPTSFARDWVTTSLAPGPISGAMPPLVNGPAGWAAGIGGALGGAWTMKRLYGKGAYANPNGMPKFGGGMLMAGVAAGAGIGLHLTRSAVQRTAQRVLERGTSGRPNMRSAMPTARSRHAASTPSRIMRQVGDYSGIGMTGDTVLALHKTGGRGGVLR